MTQNNANKSKSVRISLKRFRQQDQQLKRRQSMLGRKYQTCEQMMEHFQYKYNQEINRLSQDFFIKTNEAIESFRSIYLYQKLLQDLSQNLSNQLGRQKFSELKTIVTAYMDDAKTCLNEAKQMKQKDLQENYIIKQSFQNRVQNYLCMLFSLEIKEKKNEVQRKQNYSEYVTKYLKLHINKIQHLIDENSRVIPQKTVKEKLFPLYQKVDAQNHQTLIKNENRLDQTLRNVLSECRRIKKESDMKDELSRINEIDKSIKRNRQLSQKYKNLAAILITPFTYFQEIK